MRKGRKSTNRGLSALKLTGWPVVYRWAATGALVAYSAIGAKVVSPLAAQTVPDDNDGDGDRTEETSATKSVRKYNIPAGPLSAVLPAFRVTSGLEATAGTGAVLNVQSPGVRGSMSAEAALRALLAGTGVRYHFTDPNTAYLELYGPTTTVDVTASPQPTSVKYTQPLRDTPQTITIVDDEMIQQQGATSLTDVLQNVTGLTVVAGEGGNPAGDNLVLRGFPARNDIFVDGVRDIGPQSRDPFNMEQVEVVKGPQSAFTGRGSAGGSINLVSKAPSLRPHVNLGLTGGTANTKRVTADLNTPVGFLGERTAFRLNVMGHDSGVPGRNAVKNSRYGVAPALAFGLGSPTRAFVQYSRLEQDNISDYGIPWVPANNEVLAEFANQPSPVPRETFYGFADRDKEKMGADYGTFRIERDLGDSAMIRNQFRYGRTTRDSIATPPRFNAADSTEIKREMRSWITEDDVYDNQTDLRADFNTGGIRHSLSTGMAFTKENNIRRSRSAPNSLTTFLNPNPNDVYLGEFTYSENVGDIDANTQAAYLFDTLQFGRHIQVNGGLRAERFSADGFSTNGAPLENTTTMYNARAGIVYKPSQAGSVYASFGSSSNPSLEGLSYVGRGDDPNLDPERTYTYEVGSKWSTARDRLLLSGAFFQVEKTNARTPGVLDTDPPQILDGTQRARGIELSVTGHLTPSWMLFSGYTAMESKIIESNNANELGNNFPQAPPQSFNLWSTYNLPYRITLGGGARYVGKRYNNTSNTRFVEGYWTADLMASVPFGDSVDLRVNLTNASNEYYFSRVGGGHVVPGPARQLLATLNFRF